MVNSVEFANRLKKILDYYGLSATAFSEKIDFNRSTISHLLSGRNKPSLEFVMKVLKKFPEVELHWLLNGKGTFPSTAKESQIEIKEHSKELIKDSQPELPFVKDVRSNKEIERIVIFFKDGSFQSYE